MLGYAGARTGFPIIAADRDPQTTAAWLSKYLGPGGVEAPKLPSQTGAEITEFLLPEPNDLPHDIAIERSGTVLVTGMFTHRLYRLDPANGRISEIAIPVANANPRAIEIDSLGPGKVWFNGHFTRAPELIGSVDAATGNVVTHEVPAHPTLAAGPGGPIPYEIRLGPDGRVWGSELIGNRLFAFTPSTGRFEVFPLPSPHSGPRRFDVDARGIVWIPAYSANRVLRFDPAIRKFSEIPLPSRDAVPYIIRADPRSGAL
jgi:streptogramin lyase